jgi:hypothetical protein
MSTFTSEQKKNARQAYRQLLKAGCPVRKDGGYAQYGGLFCISAEEGNSEEWLNYYPASYTTWQNGTISDRLNDKLEAKGLYAEWYNAAVAVVYPI